MTHPVARPLMLALGLFGFAQIHAQTAPKIWRDLPEQSITAAKTRNANAANRTVVPQFYRTLQLDRAALETELRAAPREFSVPMEVSPEIEIPMPDGTIARFNLQESPVMAPELAAKFPELKTYIGQGIDDPAATLRFDLTPVGFHALVLSPKGDVYIDPYWRDSDAEYVSYFKKDYVNAEKEFHCLVESDPKLKQAREDKSSALPQRPTGPSLRIYRLALACTGEYAVYVCSPNSPTVLRTLAAMVTTVNRVSSVYERDMAIRLQLIANNDLLVYLNASTDPYTNTSPSQLLTQNQSNITSVIGTANYDIGHVFSTGGGGLAGLGVVCRSTQKARAETGTSAPVGDPYDIDYVAHEMGHQFGGNHTFNSTIGSCSGNGNSPTAFETGSGISIMAYAGICHDNTSGVQTDLLNHSDDYFHTGSYTEIDNYTTTGLGGGCPTAVATGNSAPVIGALQAYTIPANTPFSLTASATDVDGDSLTYAWEEYDTGASQSTNAPSSSGTNPVFRPFPPTLNPTRIFPSLTYILNNGNVVPALNADGYSAGEILPTVARTMNYRVTVRDNRAGGGGSNWAQTTVATVVTGSAFAVTSPNTATTFAGGSQQTVSWNVAGTTANGINCANVKISLSTDGGNTFPAVLAASVPNNGSAIITIPDIATAQGRIKVEGAGNIFFDISDANFSITSNNNAPTLNVSNGITVARGTPTATVATVATASDLDGDALTVAISNIPYRATVTPSIVGNSISLTALVDCGLVTTLVSRTYPMTLTVTDSHGATVASTVNLIVTPNATPVLGTYPTLAVPQAGSGTSISSPALTDANGNLTAAPYAITPTTLPGGGTISIDQSTGAITALAGAAATVGSPTTVRVTAMDSCGATAITTAVVSVFAGNTAASYLGGYGLSGGNADFAYDYDFDGISNLLEYALRLDPTRASRSGLPIAIAKDYAGTQYLSITFTRSSIASDVTYIVEASSDLSNWDTLASSTGGATTSGPGFVGETGSAPNFTVEVRDTVPVGEVPRFIRLRVTSP